MSTNPAPGARPDPTRYNRRYPLAHPAHAVARRGAAAIRRHALRRLGGRLLDIGCGAKWKWDIVGDLVDEYVGLDHEGSVHDHSVVDVWGTAYEIPEPDASYDSVLCTTVLEHLEDPAAALREALRVLRPGGYALYTTPFFWHLHEAPRDFFRYSPFGLRHLFETTGWEVETVEALSGFWLTFGAEWNYYVTSVLRGPLRWLAVPCVAVSNIVYPGLDAVDRRVNRRWPEFTWLHLVVARKPADAPAPGGKAGER